MDNNNIRKEINDTISIIQKTKNERTSQAKRVNEIIRKVLAWQKERNKIEAIPIKEPIMLMGRRNGNFEMYEGVTTGLFEFIHSDGNKRFIIIDANRQSNFGIGKNKIRGYWAHEDYPVTGYPDPIITTEQVNIVIDKTLNDIKKWLAKELSAKGDMFMKIGLGVGAIILALAIFFVLKPKPIEQTINYCANIANATISNITNNVSQIPTL